MQGQEEHLKIYLSYEGGGGHTALPHCLFSDFPAVAEFISLSQTTVQANNYNVRGQIEFKQLSGQPKSHGGGTARLRGSCLIISISSKCLVASDSRRKCNFKSPKLRIPKPNSNTTQYIQHQEIQKSQNANITNIKSQHTIQTSQKTFPNQTTQIHKQTQNHNQTTNISPDPTIPKFEQIADNQTT